eukprot:842897-Rhodomonas_salina.7
MKRKKKAKSKHLYESLFVRLVFKVGKRGDMRLQARDLGRGLAVGIRDSTLQLLVPKGAGSVPDIP